MRKGSGVESVEDANELKGVQLRVRLPASARQRLEALCRSEGVTLRRILLPAVRQMGIGPLWFAAYDRDERDTTWNVRLDAETRIALEEVAEREGTSRSYIARLALVRLLSDGGRPFFSLRKYLPRITQETGRHERAGMLGGMATAAKHGRGHYAAIGGMKPFEQEVAEGWEKEEARKARARRNRKEEPDATPRPG